MGLFDDILKKPSPPSGDPLAGASSYQGSGQGGGQSQQDNSSSSPSPVTLQGESLPKFVIQKSEETTIFGKDTEVAMMNNQSAQASEPNIHAEEAGDSIIISTQNPSISQNTESPSPVNISQSTGDILGQPPPITSGQSLGEEKPHEIFSSISDSQDAPVNNIFSENTTPQIVGTPEEKSFSSDIFGHIDTPSEAEVQPKEVERTSSNSENILGNQHEVSQSDITESISIPAFTTPKEFIEKSIGSIDIMIRAIERKHDEKLEEAQGYANEKNRFRKLEDQAHKEAESMDKEKAHALHMRDILVKELNHLQEETDTKKLSQIGRSGGLSKVRKSEKKEEDKDSVMSL